MLLPTWKSWSRLATMSSMTRGSSAQGTSSFWKTNSDINLFISTSDEELYHMKWKDTSLVTTSSNHFHETWECRARTSRWTLATSDPQPLWLERHQLVRSTALTSASGTSLLLISMNLTWPPLGIGYGSCSISYILFYWYWFALFDWFFQYELKNDIFTKKWFFHWILHWY